jgi:serine/threonine-protein kinase
MHRFLSEARIVASLQHPGIVQLVDVAQLPDSQLYMVLEYVEGLALNQRLHRGPVPRSTSLDILKQLCGALEAAHVLGIVHRDIKAENVVLTGDPLAPKVKLLDFGIARHALEQAITNPGMMMGTPHYMAPEQIRGHGVDGRADIYALGILAYFLFTGRLPFMGDVAEILYLHAHVMPDPPTGLAPELWRVIARAIAKDPGERFQTVRSFAEALEQVISDDLTTPHEPWSVHVSNQNVLVRFASAALWERVQREQIAHRRFFVPRHSLPAGSLLLQFEVNGEIVFTAEGEVSVRLTPEQARQWNTETGCALVLRRVQPAATEDRQPELERLVRELASRCDRNHYEFLDLAPNADGPSIFAHCEVLRERLSTVPPGSPLRLLADKAYLKLQQTRRDLCDLEFRAAYDAELGNYHGVAAALRTGLSSTRLERIRAQYVQQHPDKVARAASLMLESELFVGPSNNRHGLQLLESALTCDPLSLHLHRQLQERRAIAA